MVIKLYNSTKFIIKMNSNQKNSQYKLERRCLGLRKSSKKESKNIHQFNLIYGCIPEADTKRRE
jgi:hypothetical protein